jgi:hypothetical protein
MGDGDGLQKMQRIGQLGTVLVIMYKPEYFLDVFQNSLLA